MAKPKAPKGSVSIERPKKIIKEQKEIEFNLYPPLFLSFNIASVSTASGDTFTIDVSNLTVRVTPVDGVKARSVCFNLATLVERAVDLGYEEFKLRSTNESPD